MRGLVADSFHVACRIAPPTVQPAAQESEKQLSCRALVMKGGIERRCAERIVSHAFEERTHTPFADRQGDTFRKVKAACAV
jgi:hypothetical protein